MARRYALINPDLLEQSIGNSIEDVVYKSTLPNDQKVKILGDLIIKLQRNLDTPLPPIPVKIEQPSIESNDEEVSQVTSKDNNRESFDDISKEILQSTNSHMKRFVPLLLSRFQRSSIGYSPLAELTINEKVVKNSNIIEIISYLLRNRKEDLEPIGVDELKKVLPGLNIPKLWIANKRILPYLSASFPLKRESTSKQEKVKKIHPFLH